MSSNTPASGESTVLMSPLPTSRALNAYLVLLVRELARRGVRIEPMTLSNAFHLRRAVVHLSWPERAFVRPAKFPALRRVAKFLVILLMARIRGSRIVWTAHNLESHDRFHPWLEDFLWLVLLPQVEVVISLTEAGRDMLLARRPGLRTKQHVVTRHGHYRDAYGQPPDKSEARRLLEIPSNAPVISFVGQMRPYKGLNDLIAAYTPLAATGTHLVLAGQCSDDIRSELRHVITDLPVSFHPEFIPDDELARYVTCADLVVLPYARVLNSGSALLALSFDRPVLLPRTSIFEELQAQVGQDWVHLYSGRLTSPHLETALDSVRTARPTARPDLSTHDWRGIGDDVVRAYRLAQR